MASRFRERYLGDRAFYSTVLRIILPIVIQQGVAQFVGLLDNVMVGSLGTLPMSGVAIVNQVIFVYNLAVFGGLAGASIFGAQFFGKKDQEGIRYTLRYRLIFSVGVFLIGLTVFLLFGESLFRLFLPEGASDPADIAAPLQFARDYLGVMLWGLLPFVLTQCLSGVLRDVGETFSSMVASVIAIGVNLALNYLLIFGKLGLPALGVTGAAIATVISRYVELGYLFLRTMRRREKFPFLKGALRSLRVPLPLAKKITVTGLPLLFNEFLWSLSTAAIMACYAARGLDAVAATNISNTVWNVFSIVMMSMGNAVGILIGQILGSGDIPGAKAAVRKLLFFSVAANLVMGVLIVVTAPYLPYIYNTEDVVRQAATGQLIIAGCFMPVYAFTNGAYFTIRSGGKTFITFLSDCVFSWVICFPIAWVCAYLTDMNVVWIYFFVQCAELLKAALGYAMMRSGIWANNVVAEKKYEEDLGGSAERKA